MDGLDGLHDLLEPLLARLQGRSSLSAELCAAAARADIEAGTTPVAAEVRSSGLDEADLWVLAAVAARSSRVGCADIPVSCLQIQTSLQNAGVRVQVPVVALALVAQGWMEPLPPTSVRIAEKKTAPQ